VLLSTPLLSPARLPRTLQAFWAQQGLDRALARAMGPSAIGRTAAAHSCAEAAEDGRVVYADHPDLPVLPASNMKLLTATALLDRLGPSYRFTTKIEALAGPVDGVVHGHLYFVGGGDPLLRLPSYAGRIPDGGGVYTNVTALVSALRAAGVREVTGGVVGDETRFDSVRTVAGWPATYSEQGDVGALSALGIDDGFATAGPPVPDSAPPAVQSAGLLTKLLAAAGIEVDGAPMSGAVPPAATVLADVVSAPLSAELGEILRESDNTAMELLTKELGLKERGRGSTAAGLAAVRADLAADGFSLTGFVNADGSGLSRSDRVTCALLVEVLERAGPGGLLVRDLPVAGRSGTLVDELRGTVAAGRVHAKTGTLDGVKALSGWALASAGQGPGNPALTAPVVFATVLNDLAPVLPNPAGTPAGLTDQVALDVAEYPRAPALARFEPGGGRPGGA
jgi:D-alanyl-D-alanine carboxypeptidase/D-alanyl-D-alanine-endopeptidase (penicillin-binding protein 4)